VTGGGRFTGIDVTDDDEGNVDLMKNNMNLVRITD